MERALAADGVEAFDGSVRWVEQLRGAGLRTAVVSSSANCDAVLRAAGIDGLFELTVDGGGTPRARPARQAGARRLPRGRRPAAGARPGRAIVVEDALAGVAAGRRGRLRPRGRRGARAASAADLRAAGADIVVADLAELVA